MVVSRADPIPPGSSVDSATVLYAAIGCGEDSCSADRTTIGDDDSQS